MNKILVLVFIFFSIPVTVHALEYDFTSTKAIPIELSPLTELSTKDGIVEGERINLILLKDVYYNGQLIVKKNEIATAKVETSITAGMNGFPAEIILGDFNIPGIKSSKLIDNYSKLGQNRCLWVYPLKWALTPIPPTGSLTNLIHGGDAKLKNTDIVKIYYYPEWK